MANETVTGAPIPTKFDAPEERMIRRINALTDLPMAQIIKRGMRFALPKFMSGEVDILTLEPNPNARPLEVPVNNGAEVAS